HQVALPEVGAAVERAGHGDVRAGGIDGDAGHGRLIATPRDAEAPPPDWLPHRVELRDPRVLDARIRRRNPGREVHRALEVAREHDIALWVDRHTGHVRGIAGGTEERRPRRVAAFDAVAGRIAAGDRADLRNHRPDVAHAGLPDAILADRRAVLAI